MFRPFIFLFTAILLAFVGWTVPVYWQLVNSQLLQAVGEDTPGLIEAAANQVQLDQLGAATIFLDAADSLEV